MRKSLTYKILAAVMALSAVNVFVPHNMLAYNITSDNTTISPGTIYDNIYGNGYSFTINGGTIKGDVYGVGNANYTGDVSGGNVTINGNADVTGNVNGGYSQNSSAYSNTVNISGDSVRGQVRGGYSYSREAYDNTVNISGNAEVTGKVFGGYSQNSSAYSNTVNISGGTVTGNVHGGYSGNGEVYDNTVNISDGTIGSDQLTAYVYGGYSSDGSANGNIVNISGGSVSSTVYGGYSEMNGSADNNKIIISGSANIENADLYGSNYSSDYGNTGNTLTINGWSGTAKSIHYFENIELKNTTFTNGTVLNLQERSDLDGLENITISNFSGGQNFNKGETLTLINNTNNATINDQNFNATAGVAVDVGGVIKQDGNKVIMTVNSTNLNSQTNLAAQTRAASAAFVNQGTDLISDSLDTISRDNNYGVKTFAAVHGNRSKYDVADDIKINGWSTIVGVGNADKFDNGSEFSWGVFYENGSGNYRTYNSFNNEFFRGDGSMVYNGGGIAARYENKNGVYTEGSLRAGMLKNELDNAMRDVNGSYGYETESAYYGAHIGVGKIISLSDSSDLDIYGKFFHTYTEGDSVTIADDKFDFDSITSDRLRVGARITSNKENKFSTYYGLAYEYEFNGDADMTAQDLRADTQSLQGSSVMAEVGFNYQPTPDSPWSFDLNMRGYTGERQGGSFNVQATYTF